MKLYLRATIQVIGSNFETVHLIGGGKGHIYTKF